MRHRRVVDLKRFYDREAKAFDDFSMQAFTWQHIEVPLLNTHLKGVGPKTRVLDVGCGSGRLIGYFLGRGVGPENVAGVDFSKKLLAIASKRYPAVMFRYADATRSIPFRDPFDVVTCSMVFQDLTDARLARALGNIRRALKRGGVAFFIVPHPLRAVGGDGRRYFGRGARVVESAWGVLVTHYHRTVGDYVTAVARSGLEIVSVDEPEVSRSLKRRPQYAKYTPVPVRLAIEAKRR